MAQPLTRTQITALAIEARKAFDVQPPEDLEALRELLAAEREANGDPFACAAAVKESALFEAWRRNETARALEDAGRKPTFSFKQLTQNDYLFVRAHFVSFVDQAEAKKLYARAAEDERKRFLWIIQNECEKSGWMKYPEYPQNICMDQNKCYLEAASPDRLRRILFTVRARINAKNKTTNNEKRS
jgi:hypothetical protein